MCTRTRTHIPCRSVSPERRCVIQLDLLLGKAPATSLELLGEEHLRSSLSQVQEAQERIQAALIEMLTLNAVAKHASFLCPISLEVMRNPYFAADGHSYEHKHILKWLNHLRSEARDLRSPKTNEVLSHGELTPNHNLRGMILEALEEARREIEKTELHSGAAKRRRVRGTGGGGKEGETAGGLGGGGGNSVGVASGDREHGRERAAERGSSEQGGGGSGRGRFEYFRVGRRRAPSPLPPPPARGRPSTQGEVSWVGREQLVEQTRNEARPGDSASGRVAGRGRERTTGGGEVSAARGLVVAAMDDEAFYAAEIFQVL